MFRILNWNASTLLNFFQIVKILVLSVSILSCNQSSKEPPIPKEGVLDLQTWNFETDGILPLDGEWEFYWNRFVSYEDLMKTDPPLSDGLILVPSFWNDKNVNSEVKPDDALSRIQSGGSGKSGWCFIGEDRGFRTCSEIGENDRCMSGDIFPSQEICMNPNLRP